MRWPAALFVPVLGIVGLLIAEADEPVDPSAQAVPTVAHDATPRQPPVPYPVPLATVSDKNSEADRIDHLRQAAEHLQAAGLNSLADHVRGLSTAPVAVEPSNNSGFINAPVQQVLLRFKLLELDEENLRRLGLDFSQTQILNGPPGLNGLVDAFRQDGLVRVFAEPTITTILGRQAQFRSGSEVLLWSIGPDGKPVHRPEPYGTHVECVPRLIDKRGLRLELRFEYSEVDRGKTVLVAGKENPAIRKVVVDTALDIKFDETIALSCTLPGGAGPTGSALMVMLVTAEAVEPIAAAQPSGRLPRQ
jgi:hypothetical protein